MIVAVCTECNPEKVIALGSSPGNAIHVEGGTTHTEISILIFPDIAFASGDDSTERLAKAQRVLPYVLKSFTTHHEGARLERRILGS